MDTSTFHFPIKEVLQKTSSGAPLLNFGNLSLNTFWKLKKVELVKNDFQKAQIVTHYCYWTLFLSNWKYISSWLISLNTNVVYTFILLLLLLTLKVPLCWTLFKPFLLNIILTHITKGLRILCLCLSILGSVDVHFTQEPSNPSYFNNGSDANLVWDYTDPHNKIQHIIYSVLVNVAFVRVIFNDSHGVQEHPSIPPSYKGRVKIKGRATLVIENINPGDNTIFRCEIGGSFVGSIESTVQLIVAGMYYRYTCKH